MTAADKTKVYGQVNPALTFAYGPFQGTDTAAVIDSAPICSTTATQYSNVGTYPITCSGGVDNNYEFSYTAGTLTITKATVTVTAANKTRPYNTPNRRSPSRTPASWARICPP